ncbi:MAG: amidohydrolase [Balneolaceae bacterium]|nr:MAG: amidohydrolase [Balneolaceae bacterium]
MTLTDIRQQLHRLAETAHQEKETAAFVAARLRETGISDIREGIGGYGLVATIDSGRPGPSLLFRAELDALPIDETVSLPYASRNSNVAHKCGHDGHMAVLIGLAQALQERPLARGKVHLLFQPAEETGEGAEKMLEDHKMSGIAPDFAFAIHNLPGFPRHSVLLREDVFAAGSAGLIIRLTGNTAHAAHPEQGRSPAPAVASLITALQALPGSVLPSGRFGLATIIHVRIGDQAFGTTPGRAVLMATLRAWEPEDLEQLREQAVGLAHEIAETHGLECGHEWTEVFHPTVNNPDAVKMVRKAAEKLSAKLSDGQPVDRAEKRPEMQTGKQPAKGGEKQPAGLEIRNMAHPFSWSEDFGRFTDRFPGALVGIGAGEDHPHLHDTRYDFPDEILETGAALFAGIIDECGLF